MNKNMRTLLIVAAVAAVAYMVYAYMKHKGQSNQGTGTLGANLNSAAPELVGGSTGPSVGPAVDLPINITLTESVPASQSGGKAAGPQTNPTSIPSMNSQDGGVGVATATAAAQPREVTTPMRSSALRTPDKMSAQSRAAGHPDAKSGKQSPHPATHAAHHRTK